MVHSTVLTFEIFDSFAAPLVATTHIGVGGDLKRREMRGSKLPTSVHFRRRLEKSICGACPSLRPYTFGVNGVLVQSTCTVETLANRRELARGCHAAKNRVAPECAKLENLTGKHENSLV